DGLTTPPLLSVGEPGRCFGQFRHEGASGCIRFPGLGQLPHDRPVMAENFPQLPHQVKRVHLVDSVRVIVDALPDPYGAITVADHDRSVVDVVERVDEAASRLLTVAGLGPVVTLVYPLVLVTVTAW